MVYCGILITMRFFIALEIPEESKKELKEVQKQLQAVIPEIRLTDNEKLHLTIAFVGEQPEEIKEDLVAILKKTTLDISSFEITPGFIDGFPHLHSAHTFFVGVKGDIDKLMVLRERVKDGLISLGLPTDERRYIPHIAIAKVKDNFKIHPDQEAKLQGIMLSEFAPIKISSIKLFESIPEEPARNTSASVARRLAFGKANGGQAGGGFHTHNTLAEIPLQ